MYGDVPRELEEALEQRASELEELLGTRPQVRTMAGDAAAIIQAAAEEGDEPTLTAVGSRGLGALQAHRARERLHRRPEGRRRAGPYRSAVQAAAVMTRERP